MLALADVARFLPADPEAVVAAAFTCPCCLRVDADVRGDVAHQHVDDVTLECGCRICGTEWKVMLDADQVLRLALHPPTSQGHGWRLRIALR